MDPDETYYAMFCAMRDGNHKAREYAIALRDWLDKGGCWPRFYSKAEVKSYLSSVLRRTESCT